MEADEGDGSGLPCLLDFWWGAFIFTTYLKLDSILGIFYKVLWIYQHAAYFFLTFFLSTPGITDSMHEDTIKLLMKKKYREGEGRGG